MLSACYEEIAPYNGLLAVIYVIFGDGLKKHQPIVNFGTVGSCYSRGA